MGVRGYLERLGHDGLPRPDLATLVDLHRRHLALVPYENLGIMLGRPPSVAPDECLARIATVGRAGYCFHHNGALELVLRELGYAVSRRHGHVWTDPSMRHDRFLNHLVLVVSGLPTDANPGGRWWVDAGLGDAFRDPVPLVGGELEQDGFRYALSDVAAGGWSFRHDPAGGFSGVEIGAEPVGHPEVEASHAELSKADGGTFTRFLVVHRRGPDAVDSLLGCTLRHVTPGGVDETELTTYGAWRAALTDAVGVPLDDVARDELEDLWVRTRASHEQHKRDQAAADACAVD